MDDWDKFYFWFKFKDWLGVISLIILWLVLEFGMPILVIWLCAKYIFHII
ncbi:Protein of unknown function [Lactobacillus pasteurii DSM 23907 = CRBIP 24.76]|uniref:Uncharacterized protein n=1 Tax=Lactobacillus pasteurii DSM 23907 = CRBIP 24.76 TaxID=1423790 RepID=I7LB75_9LACO|nr:Protein of unknown function [Lactobacillus pasteurii DSM 23907 = CRBIP 24.76]